MTTSKVDTENRCQDWLSGFIRLHILHHATKEALIGHWMIEELRRHGYRLSPGTLYPMLRAMEQKGYLRSIEKREGRRFWREYPRNCIRSQGTRRRQGEATRTLSRTNRRIRTIADERLKMHRPIKQTSGGKKETIVFAEINHRPEIEDRISSFADFRGRSSINLPSARANEPLQCDKNR